MTCSRSPIILLILTAMLSAGCGTARDWRKAQAANTLPAYRYFLELHPQGRHVDEAKAAIEGLEWDEASSQKNLSAFLHFYYAHPGSSRIAVSQGIVASKTDYSSTCYGPAGCNATFTLLVTVDGAKLDMAAEDLCMLGIVQCDAAMVGPPALSPEAPRTAKIVRDKSSGRILAVDFAGQAAAAPSDAIHDAVVCGNVEEVKALLKSDPSLANSRDDAKHTPLLEATARGNEDLVELLLANHADPNAKDKDGATPLHFAAHNGSEQLAERLLASHADVNAKENFLTTPLVLAVGNGHKDVAELLLAHHADVNARDSFGETPSHSARSAEMAELLHRHGGHE